MSCSDSHWNFAAQIPPHLSLTFKVNKLYLQLITYLTIASVKHESSVTVKITSNFIFVVLIAGRTITDKSGVLFRSDHVIHHILVTRFIKLLLCAWPKYSFFLCFLALVKGTRAFGTRFKERKNFWKQKTAKHLN